MHPPPPPLKLYYFLSISWIIPAIVVSGNVSFDFTAFSLSNLTLLGDSYLRNGSVISLTRETEVPASSSGTAITAFAIQFLDSRKNISASFATKFSFSITNSSSGPYGDGLTFFVSSNNATLGSTGGDLGVFNSSTLSSSSKSSIIAVEFDTKLDVGLNDLNDNHVGLDVDSPVSVASADLDSRGIYLKSGKMFTTWISYDAHQHLLKVWVGESSVKPEDPILSTVCDLSKHFEEYMYVGFSASIEGSTEVHTIQGWSFETFDLDSIKNISSSVPHNTSGDSWSDEIPTIPISDTPSVTPRKKLGLGLAVLGPVTFGVAFVVAVWISFKKWMENKVNNKGDFSQELLKGPRKFSYKELKFSTKGFHSSRVIGSGAFGTVYKAVLPQSGITYAVKRSKHAHQSRSEFVAELSIIARLRHKNLVQLQGWCADKNELLLVYEFMPNGSLDKILYCGYEPTTGCSLKWSHRYNVAIGIASVLSYLHQECEQQVIHRDIKTSNIMLDGNFNPRLGDFGLARLMDHNESPVSTLTAGTMGYLAPEYLQNGKATEMTDVYSYGVVILEVCCGRRPIDNKDSKDRKLVNLVDWVWSLYSEDKLIEAADYRLNGDFNKEEMLKLLLVGLSCANPNYMQRPSMRRVIQILNSEAEPVTVPKTKPVLTFASTSNLSMKDIVVSAFEGVPCSAIINSE